MEKRFRKSETGGSMGKLGEKSTPLGVKCL